MPNATDLTGYLRRQSDSHLHTRCPRRYHAIPEEEGDERRQLEENSRKGTRCGHTITYSIYMPRCASILLSDGMSSCVPCSRPLLLLTSSSLLVLSIDFQTYIAAAFV